MNVLSHRGPKDVLIQSISKVTRSRWWKQVRMNISWREAFQNTSEVCISFATSGHSEAQMKPLPLRRPIRITHLIGICYTPPIPGGGGGNPLQYPCLEDPHKQRSLAGYSSWGHKLLDGTTEHSPLILSFPPIGKNKTTREKPLQDKQWSLRSYKA